MRRILVVAALSVASLSGTALVRGADDTAPPTGPETEFVPPGDAKRLSPIEVLQRHLKELYPDATVQATPIAEAVLLRGKVAKAEHIPQIVEIADQFYPKVLNQLEVATPPVPTAPVPLAPSPPGLSAPFEGQPAPFESNAPQMPPRNDLSVPPTGQPRAPGVPRFRAAPKATPSNSSPDDDDFSASPRPQRSAPANDSLFLRSPTSAPPPTAVPAPQDLSAAPGSRDRFPPAGPVEPLPVLPRLPENPKHDVLLVPARPVKVSVPIGSPAAVPEPVPSVPREPSAPPAGPGAASAPGGNESVRTLHDEVRALRKDVQRLILLLEKKAETSAVPVPAKSMARSHTEAEKKILRALDQKLNLEFKEGTLKEFCTRIADKCDLNVMIDVFGLQEEGIEPDRKVQLNLKDSTLRGALTSALKPLGVAYVIEDGLIKVTSRQRALGNLVVVTYPVADLIVPVPNFVTPTAATAHSDEEAASVKKPAAIDSNSLIEVIQSTVDPDSWDVAGGPASIRGYSKTLSLVIRQTKGAHLQIADLLAQLREQMDLQVAVSTVVLSAPSKEILEKSGIDMAKSEEGGGVTVEDKSISKLITSLRKHGPSNVWQAPRVTLFNGQSAELSTPRSGRTTQNAVDSLVLQSVVSADRQYVRVSAQVRGGTSPGGVVRRVLGRIPEGKAMLVDVTPQAPDGVATFREGEQPFGEGVPPRGAKTYLLLRPQIVVPENDEDPFKSYPPPDDRHPSKE
jgi:hypothetical protein